MKRILATTGLCLALGGCAGTATAPLASLIPLVLQIPAVQTAVFATCAVNVAYMDVVAAFNKTPNATIESVAALFCPH